MQLFKNLSKVFVSLERGIAARRVGPGRTIRAWMKYRVRLVEYRRTRAGLGRREKARKCHGASVDARGARVGASRARARAHAFQCERARRMRASSTVDEREKRRAPFAVFACEWGVYVAAAAPCAIRSFQKAIAAAGQGRTRRDKEREKEKQ